MKTKTIILSIFVESLLFGLTYLISPFLAGQIMGNIQGFISIKSTFFALIILYVVLFYPIYKLIISLKDNFSK